MLSARRLKILKLRLRWNLRITTFVKTHGSLRMTPAMAAGIEKRSLGRLPNWLNVVENKKDYIARVQVAFNAFTQLRRNLARKTVPVHEVFHGQTVWQGEVEVLTCKITPKAKRAYAWSHRDGKNDDGERFVAVLEIPLSYLL